MQKSNKFYSLTKLSIAVAASLSIASSVHAETEKTEKITVTGSRIASIGAESPSPVTVIDASEIKASGVTNITQLLNKLPSMAPGLTATSGAVWGNAGITTQNLRGQGSKRTLTLVNGRRHVGSIPGESTVDMNTIPVALIERIEILTGGASSIYGADAVAGVVNIITKKDFEGSELTLNTGITDRNDGENYGFNFTHGLNFDNDKGNLVFHVTYDESKRARAADRRFASRELVWIDNPAEAGLSDDDKKDNGIPDRIVDERYRLLSTPVASTFIGDRPVAFNPDGSIRDIILGEGELYDAHKGFGLAYTGAGGEQLSQNANQLVQAPVEKFVFNSTLNYEINDDLYLYTDVKYTQSEASTTYGYAKANYGGSANNSQIFIDNPYLAQSSVDYMQANNLNNVEFAKIYTDLGRAGTKYERDLFQVVTALEGFIFEDYQWQTYVQYGKSTSDNTSLNSYYQAHWDASIDPVRNAAGNIVCSVALSDAELEQLTTRSAYNIAHIKHTRDQLIASGASPQDCVPHNVFATDGAALQDYMQYDTTSSQEQSQFVAHANISGDIYELPAGPLAFSAGVEYRKEKSETEPSDIQKSGLGSGYAISQAVVGEYSVREAFVELSVPVLEGVEFAEALDLSLSARLSDYSEAGTSTSWNVGLTYQPIEDIKLRISRSKSARAPNINEQFTDVSTKGDWAYQPCGVRNIERLDEKYLDNCRALGLDVTTTPDGKPTSNINWYTWATLRSSGNKELDVETANTLTAGLVFTPSFVDGLTVTVDYWDIKLDQLIGTFSHAAVLKNCVESESIDNQFCKLIERRENGEVISVDLKTLNLNQRRTKGIDFETVYKFDGSTFGLDAVPGEFRFKTLVQHLIRRDVQTDPNLPLEPTRGLFAYPMKRATLGLTYTLDNFEFQWNSRYIGEQKRSNRYTAEKYAPHHTGGLWYTDVSVSYSFTDDLTMSAGINNLTDRGTPQMPDANVGGASVYIENDTGLYDVLGKSYFANLTYRF